MDYVGISLIIALFCLNAFSIDFINKDKKRIATIMNIASLCLIVALAYNFNQINDIIKIFIIIAVIVIAFLILRLYFSRKKKKANKEKETEQKQIESENEDENN